MSDAARLMAKLNSNEHGVVKTMRATVSSYREDGLVNLSYGTTHIFGVPCLDSYTGRNPGDVVQVLNLGANNWVVLGRIGNIDPNYLAPTTQNNGYALYYTDTLTSRGPYDPGYEGVVGKTATPGDRPLLLAWSYYNGTSNSLNVSSTGKHFMVVTVARSNVPHGKREAVELQLCPHNFNTLPTTLTLNTSSFSPVIFRLEIGELRGITLPSDWFAAISATTPTIKGFAVQPVTTSSWDDSYAIFSPTSGGIRAV